MPEFTSLAKLSESAEYDYKEDIVSVTLCVRKIYLGKFEKYLK